jgi:DNA-binding transcriptional ArsR family regulator
MIDRLEEIFQRFDPLYDPLSESHRDRISQTSDQEFIEDYRLIEKTFTQDTTRFDKIEIVPTLFQPYSASLFTFAHRLQVALGIELANSIRHSRQFDTKQKSDFFKNLSDPTRYEMLLLLVKADHTNKQLADALGVTAPNITYHFRSLLKDGLVKLDLTSDKPRYRINREHFNRILLELTEDLDLTGIDR